VNVLPFFLATTASLFVVVDPVGTVPFFVALTRGYDEADRRAILLRAILTVAGVLSVFVIAGKWLFQAYGFTLSAVQISGGILLFYMAFQMLYGEVGTKISAADREEAIARRDELAIAPLGIPLLAGPGSIATVMIYEGAAGGSLLAQGAVFLAVLLISLLSFVTLYFGQRIFGYLGRVGITAIVRIMGLLLAAVAVQFVINGIQGAALTVP
jgi:multiple antibiotic resistance protein